MKSYLYHHGILGQRWGVRRFENEDGTLTAAGRKRYEEDSNGNYKPVSNKSNTSNNKPVSDKSNTENNKPEKTKNNDIDNKTGDKLNKKDQEKFDKLTDKYKKEGLSNEEAQKKAAYDLAKEKNLKVFRNVALATVGVAAIAGAGYAYYKHKTSSVPQMMEQPYKNIFEDKKYVVENGRNICDDIVLKMDGTPELYRVQAKAGKANLDHAMYVATNKEDADVYKNKLTQTFINQGKQNVTQQIMKTKKDIKVAGVDSCKNAFASLMENDKEFEKAARSKAKEVADNAFLYKMMGFDPNVVDACKELAKGSGFGDKESNGHKLSMDKQYLAFNFLLTGEDADYRPQIAKFYGALKDKGYHAVDDLNDRGHSGYNTKAMILFDAKDVVGDITVKELVKSGVDMRGVNDVDDIIKRMWGNAA